MLKFLAFTQVTAPSTKQAEALFENYVEIMMKKLSMISILSHYSMKSIHIHLLDDTDQEEQTVVMACDAASDHS